MSYVLSETASGGGTQDFIISKEGPGRLYYRLGLRYAPTDLNLDPLDMGFVVQRRYEAVDNPEDVSQDSDGIWHIKAGARVRVHMTHGGRQPPLPRGPGRPAAGRAGNRQPGAGRFAERSRRRPDQLVPTAGGGGEPGTSTRTCAMTAPRPSPPCSGTASTNTPTSPVPPPPAPSSSRPPKPKRCTPPKSLAAAPVIG